MQKKELGFCAFRVQGYMSFFLSFFFSFLYKRKEEEEKIDWELRRWWFDTRLCMVAMKETSFGWVSREGRGEGRVFSLSFLGDEFY